MKAVIFVYHIRSAFSSYLVLNANVRLVGLLVALQFEFKASFVSPKKGQLFSFYLLKMFIENVM